MAHLMVIAAHPEDLFERVGGVGAKHIERGDWSGYDCGETFIRLNPWEFDTIPLE